jgi:hypothetical protein
MAMETNVSEIRLGEGTHVVETTDTDGIPIRRLQVNVPLRFVGEGIQQTIIKGGVLIGGAQYHAEQRRKNGDDGDGDGDTSLSEVAGIEFHRMTLTNPEHVGIQDDGGLPLIMEDCEVTECNTIGVNVRNGTSLTMRRCVIHHNGTSGIYLSGERTIGQLINCKSYCNVYSGIVAYSGSRIDLYGEATEVYENGCGGEGHGIKVSKVGSEVCFHIPDHDRYVRNNYGQRNMKEYKGGKVVNVHTFGEGRKSGRSTTNSNSVVSGSGSGEMSMSFDLEKQSQELVAQVLFKSRSNSFG